MKPSLLVTVGLPVVAMLVVGCGGEVDGGSRAGAEPGPPECRTSLACAEGQYCAAGSCVSSVEQCPSPQEPVEIVEGRDLIATVVMFRGEEAVGIRSESWKSPSRFIPLRGGDTTSVPLLEEHETAQCSLGLSICTVRGPEQRDLYGDFKLVGRSWLPSWGPRTLQLASDPGTVVGLEETSLWLEHDGVVQQFGSDGAASAPAYGLDGGRAGRWESTAAGDWWVQRRTETGYDLMLSERPGIWQSVLNDPTSNTWIAKTTEGFVAATQEVHSSEPYETWSFYKLNPGGDAELLGSGPAPRRDPSGERISATIRQGAVFLAENYSLRVSCEDSSCQLFETDLARVSVTGLAAHELPGRAGLKSTRYLGCGVMEYVAAAYTYETDADGNPVVDENNRFIVASSSLWQGRLGAKSYSE